MSQRSNDSLLNCTHGENTGQVQQNTPVFPMTWEPEITSLSPVCKTWWDAVSKWKQKKGSGSVPELDPKYHKHKYETDRKKKTKRRRKEKDNLPWAGGTMHTYKDLMQGSTHSCLPPAPGQSSAPRSLVSWAQDLPDPYKVQRAMASPPHSHPCLGAHQKTFHGSTLELQAQSYPANLKHRCMQRKMRILTSTDPGCWSHTFQKITLVPT